MTTLVFASSNQNKIAEIRAMLPENIRILSLADIGCHDEIPETSDTIEGNAVLKSNYISKNYGCDCFSDDSGLEVDALNGAPGVYSARYAGEPKSDANNINKLLRELQNIRNRKANFKTVIALNFNGNQHLFTGMVHGEIIDIPRGIDGFGYDPVFIPVGYSNTFAEMAQTEKAAISHRGKAVQQLIAFMTK